MACDLSEGQLLLAFVWQTGCVVQNAVGDEIVDVWGARNADDW